jgi:ATP-dependent DNA helicase RecQ
MCGSEMTFAQSWSVIVIATMSDVRTARDVFGISVLKAEQRECISLVHAGKDVIAILRTGYGKSLCYQIPCATLPGFAVVISPLLALCMDQVQSMRAHGLNAVKFDGSVEYETRKALAMELQEQKTTVKALFTTPETLTSSQMLQRCLQAAASCGNVSFVVVDEAHCVEMWSDFRWESMEAEMVIQIGHVHSVQQHLPWYPSCVDMCQYAE